MAVAYSLPLRADIKIKMPGPYISQDQAKIGPTGRASGGPRISSAHLEISDGIGPGPPEPDQASLFQFKSDRSKNRAGRAGPKTRRARAGFGPFGPERPSLPPGFPPNPYHLPIIMIIHVLARFEIHSYRVHFHKTFRFQSLPNVQFDMTVDLDGLPVKIAMNLAFKYMPAE